MATISIAMATYNGAQWLAGQLASFAAQTRLPDELVVTDDNSSDGSDRIVKDFAATAPFPVRFTRNPIRRGFNGNFAAAIGLARADVIFISDQDDVWYPDKIERVMSRFANDPGCLCVTNDQAIADADGRLTGRTVLGNVRAIARQDSWYGPGCCTAFSRALLPIVMPMPGDVVAYDHWINMLAEATGTRAILDAPLQLYRRHDQNASGSVFAQSRPGIRHLVAAARRGDASAAITAKVVEIDAILARLGTTEAAALADPAALRAAIVALQGERADYAARSAALGRARPVRVAAVLGLLASGRYRRFSGPMTALKDLLS